MCVEARAAARPVTCPRGHDTMFLLIHNLHLLTWKKNKWIVCMHVKQQEAQAHRQQDHVRVLTLAILHTHTYTAATIDLGRARGKVSPMDVHAGTCAFEHTCRQRQPGCSTTVDSIAHVHTGRQQTVLILMQTWSHACRCIR